MMTKYSGYNKIQSDEVCFGFKSMNFISHGIPFVIFPVKCAPTEKSHLEVPLEENVNRIIPDEGAVEARTIEDAIAVLRY